MKKKRLLWISHLIPYPPKGGVLQRSYFLLRELSNYFEIDLIAFNQESLISPFYNGDIELAIVDSRKNLSKFCKSIEFFPIPKEQRAFGKIRLALESLTSTNPYTINWLKSKKLEDHIKAIALKENYDIVHFDTISLDIYQKYFQKTPCVLDHHNIESHMLIRRAKNETSILKKLYFFQEGFRLKRYEKSALSNYTGHITCSDIDTERLDKIVPELNIKTIPNGVDTNFFRTKGLQQDPATLIFVGTMNWYPNIEAVLYLCKEVMPLIRIKNLKINLKVIGANPPENIKALGKEYDDIEIMGFVDEIRDHLEKATIYVCPIMDGGGTKLKILDAMAMSKAIIAHRVASEGIDVTDGRNIIMADSPSDYSNAIIRLLKDSKLRCKLGTEARKLVEQKYDVELIGKSLSDYYTMKASL